MTAGAEYALVNLQPNDAIRYISDTLLGAILNMCDGDRQEVERMLASLTQRYLSRLKMKELLAAAS